MAVHLGAGRRSKQWRSRWCRCSERGSYTTRTKTTLSTRTGVTLVDPLDGRPMHSHRYMDGLHEALEAKEGIAGHADAAPPKRAPRSTPC